MSIVLLWDGHCKINDPRDQPLKAVIMYWFFILLNEYLKLEGAIWYRVASFKKVSITFLVATDTVIII